LLSLHSDNKNAMRNAVGKAGVQADPERRGAAKSTELVKLLTLVLTILQFPVLANFYGLLSPKVS
jgi:hypothetical protein